MFHSHSILNPPFPTPSTFPSWATELYNPKWITNEYVLRECVMCIFGTTFIYVIEGIDSKVISVCLINDYSLIAVLYIFDYGSAECESISIKCTKVKLSI